VVGVEQACDKVELFLGLIGVMSAYVSPPPTACADPAPVIPAASPSAANAPTRL